jgi:hypothetical protein
MAEIKMVTRIQGTNPATGRLKYAAGTGELVEYRETGHHGTVAVVRWTNGVETTHCRNLDNSNVQGLEFPAEVPADIRAVTDRFMELRLSMVEETVETVVRIETRGSEETMQALEDQLTELDSVETTYWDAADENAVYAVLRTEIPVDQLPIEPAVFPGDHRDGCECEDCDAFYADDVNDTWIANDTAEQEQANLEPGYVAAVESWNAHVTDEIDWSEETRRAEVDFRDSINASTPPNWAPEVTSWLGITSVELPRRWEAVIQLRGKLVWGQLIGTTNRRTRFSEPLLATVEIDGRRHLVSSQDLLLV